MKYDVIIVGGGVAGLTAASFLSKSGYTVLVCEKEKKVGGLVNSFDYKEFTFDGGIRAIENSGIVMPMLKQLGIDIDFVKNNVSVGIEGDVLSLVSKKSLVDYQTMLNKLFPEHTADIQRIIDDIKLIMKHMEVLYGIDNPIFMDLKHDKEYLYGTLLPWLFKFIFTIGKIQKLNTPIDAYLRTRTDNQVLIDMIAQHFFQKTPTFFALSYFSLYLDYQYPKGGTGKLTEALEQFVLDHKGTILTDTSISLVKPEEHVVQDTKGNVYHYKKLIWASDLKTLYNNIDMDAITHQKTKQQILSKKAMLADKIGGDSVFSLYMTLDMDKRYFEAICTPHFFYTPSKKGLTPITPTGLNGKTHQSDAFPNDKQSIIAWLKQFFADTTYEISFPVLRDATLAPEGKTGVIISTLLDYELVKHIQQMGWYDEFKEMGAKSVMHTLDASIFPGIKSKVIDYFSSTPLTMEKLTGNADGAITGWAFTNSFVPAVNHMAKVSRSVLTPIPDVLQAGKWTYSPAGLPISILTAKLAAVRIEKQLKKTIG